MDIVTIAIIIIIVIAVIAAIIFAYIKYQPKIMVGTSNNSEFATKLLKELNNIRQNPKEYTTYVYNRKSDYRPESVRETIEFLNKAVPCSNILQMDSILAELSQKWTDIQSNTIDVGHGNFPQRMISLRNKYLEYSENLSYGRNDAIDVLVDLIVDEDILDRGHRKNIFNCNMTHIGISSGSHKYYGSMAGMIFGRKS